MNNSFGKLVSISIFGESHGCIVGCLVDGCPSSLPLYNNEVQQELERRKPGKSAYVSQRSEKDLVKILSGVFNNKTTGSPITLVIENTDCRSNDYFNLKETFRPGHADYTYAQKYRNRDYRGGGRASARVTAAVVAGGAVSKKWLRLKHGSQVKGYLSELKEIKIPFIHWTYVNNNCFFSPNISIINTLTKQLRLLIKAGNSVGSRLALIMTKIPIGIGEPLFNKLDASIACGLMSLNAVKDVEIGSGYLSSSKTGLDLNDALTPDGFLSNHSGGILGGISTGSDVIVFIAIKPTSSISLFKRSVSDSNRPTYVRTKGRHDPCIGIRAVPVAEAIVSVIIMDFILQTHFSEDYQNSNCHLVHPKAYLY
ncbi:chorismate synthase [Candidatus Tremblaya phenacola]|uniref:chorismate synthase n=1 Tax=Candidatus Tremblayella phenacoccinincola TaxID=1010676 RepID=UPI0013302A08|nr:chorismate synthase [Candidatus Tremblaya phenacola]KAH0998329.1 Chorismate synthase [Candidatus Tremblaya phenacola]